MSRPAEEVDRHLRMAALELPFAGHMPHIPFIWQVVHLVGRVAFLDRTPRRNVAQPSLKLPDLRSYRSRWDKVQMLNSP